MEEILNRFYKYNQHANSYTWKYNGECGPGVWALVGRSPGRGLGTMFQFGLGGFFNRFYKYNQHANTTC